MYTRYIVLVVLRSNCRRRVKFWTLIDALHSVKLLVLDSNNKSLYLERVAGNS